MNIAFIIAISVFLAIITYMAFNLDKQHLPMKFFLIFMVLFTFPVMSKGFLEDCQWLESSSRDTFIYGDNFTGYHWDYDYTLNQNADKGIYVFHINTTKEYDYVCETINQDGAIGSFINVTTWLIRVFSIYLIIYITYIVFDYFKNVRDKA